MLTLTIDFNAQADGLVRGLQTGVSGDGELTRGVPVILIDGEGSAALGSLRDVRDGLVFAAVDWDTYGDVEDVKAVAAPRETVVTGVIDDNEGWQIQVVERQLLPA